MKDMSKLSWLCLLPPADQGLGISDITFLERLDSLGNNMSITVQTRPSDEYQSRYKVYPGHSPQSDSIETTHLHIRDYWVLPNLRQPRWFFPTEPNLLNEALVLLPSSLKGRILRHLITLGLLPRHRLRIAVPQEPEIERALAKCLDVESVRIALAPGTPGAYQKVTALVLSAEGQKLGYVKMGWSPAARQMVAVERQNLEFLGTLGQMCGAVPRVLGWLGSDSYDGLLISKGPEKVGPSKLDRVHLTFLSKLAAATSVETEFGHSNTWLAIQEGVHSVKSKVSRAWANRLDASLQRIVPLCSTTMRLSMAHRDFTPWNTRLLDNKQLYVFDWESAKLRYIPMYDVFHFDVMQSILSGLGHIWSSKWRQWVAHGRVAWQVPEDQVGTLYLAYLLDLSIFYLRARIDSPEVGTDQVADRIATELDYMIERLG